MTAHDTSQNSVSQSRRVGYARVSTNEQNVDLQVDALQHNGCDPVFNDVGVSGSARTRPALDECLAVLHEGDTLVVWRLDRLGRSLQHLLEIVADLNGRGIGFVSLSEHIDTTSAAGKLIFSVFGALAEYERAMIRERVGAGIAAAKRRGVRMGRRPALTPSRRRFAQELVDSGETPAVVARMLKVGRATVYRALLKAGEKSTAT